MKKLLIGFVVLLCLVGGSVGAMKWLELGPFEKKGGDTAAETPPPEPEHKAQFIEMEPLLINVFDDNQVLGNFQFEIKLEVRNQDHYDEVRRKSPLLKDAFIQDLHTFIPRLLKKKKQLDLTILQQRLKLRAGLVLGKGKVYDVLIQSVVDTPQK